jgi:two-component system nitrate/nitrite response regulator NarL
MPEAVDRIRILIADDHPIFRHGLRKLLEADPEFSIVGEASDGHEARQQVAQTRPDLLLLDVAMPRHGGLEALPELCAASPATRILLLTAEIGQVDLLKALQIGARGVLLKDAAVRLLPRAIRSVRQGSYWIGAEAVSDLGETLRRLSSAGPDRRYGLTPREIEIVTAVVGGQSNRDIADRFSISQQTVKHHLTSIFDKLGVSSRLELALFALKHHITDDT